MSRKPFSAVAAAGALIVLAAAAGCSRAPRRSGPLLTSGASRGANVLLVTIDTLRRDRVGVYAGPSGLTPTLDGLAARGVRYDEAFSHVPMTLPAHASILTGRTPRGHGVRNNTTFRLDGSVPTLGGALKQAGYRTGAFVAAFVLDARFGLNRGFDVYDDRLPRGEGPAFHFDERPADEVVNAAGDWILAPPSGSGGPWFAWVHLFDPHAPYRAPEAFRHGRSAYDAEVAYADAAIGRLLDRIRAAGQLERTLIVVTADHGESLGDHGETTHGLFAYDATIRVPLIVGGPGVRAGAVGAAAGHADIMPTVLDLVGAGVPDQLEGRSLAGETPPGRPLYFEALDASITRGWAPLRGVVQRGWKYIDLPEAELYDLAADPSERHNLAGRDAHEKALRDALARIERLPGSPSPPAAVDADAAARLRALGYVGGTSADRKTAYTAADDPKRLVGLNERFNTALTAFDEGRAADALAGFSAVLAERPDFLSARTSAATVLLSQGRSGEAVSLLRSAPADQLTSPSLLSKLAAALRDSGDLRGAIGALEEARRRGGEHLDLLQDLAIVYAAAGRRDDARALFGEITRRYETVPTAWYNLGLFEMQNGRVSPAAAAFRSAVQRDPFYADAWQALGAVLAPGNPQAARDAWRRAERLRPHDYDLLFNIAVLSADGPRPSEAIPYLRRFIEEAPRDRYAADIERVRQILDGIERGSR